MSVFGADVSDFVTFDIGQHTVAKCHSKPHVCESSTAGF